MEFRFKSSEYDGEELIKSFKNDFETTDLSEEEYLDFKKGVIGSVKETHINKVFVIFQNYVTSTINNHTLHVVQNEPVFLLQFVFQGDFSISLDKDTDNVYSLKKHKYNLFYVPASNHLFTYRDQKKEILNIYFTESYLKEKMGSYFLDNNPDFLNAKKEKKIFSFFHQGMHLNVRLRNIVYEFLNCSFNGIIKKTYFESKLTELILIALNTPQSQPSNLKKEDKESLIMIEDYIKSHLNEELNIEKLSQQAGFNTSKFKTLFKELYGKPVFKYITHLRIEEAIELISKNDYSISEASYEVGYKNPQHFTVAFKKKLGYLPSQLIKD
ncbi:hypothetical protein BBFL7_01780 [Flavobacteria bacterium BBFL7]|nr:hypothetical protein BBFL7_01780 [Flavobacteria bacterium BBFL7]